jgi:hypothetical protein
MIAIKSVSLRALSHIRRKFYVKREAGDYRVGALAKMCRIFSRKGSGPGCPECLFRENSFGKLASGLGYEAVSVPILEHFAPRLVRL